MKWSVWIESVWGEHLWDLSKVNSEVSYLTWAIWVWMLSGEPSKEVSCLSVSYLRGTFWATSLKWAIWLWTIWGELLEWPVSSKLSEVCHLGINPLSVSCVSVSCLSINHLRWSIWYELSEVICLRWAIWGELSAQVNFLGLKWAVSEENHRSAPSEVNCLRWAS